MLLENRTILKTINMNTYGQLKKIESKESQTIQAVTAKNGQPSLSLIKNNQTYFVHSQYNPEREMQSFLQRFQTITEDTHVLFIGTGLGMHISSILKQFPDISFSIFEPNIEVLDFFLDHVDLSQSKWRNCIDIFTSWETMKNPNQFVEWYTKQSQEITLPAYATIYKNEIYNFFEHVKAVLKDKRSSLGTSAAFQNRWIINSIMNFKKVIQTPDFLETQKETLKNQPVLLVAAGPSLTYDLPLIKQIKEEGRAYIFAVGSAVNALIAVDIMPDAMFSYDPSALNQAVVQKIKERELSIPLVFGSSIGFETLQNYPGSLSHFITSQDKLSQYVFDMKNQNHVISDQPSIAVLTLDILMRLQCNPIILAGQNLGFFNNQRYSKEINYQHISNELNETEKKKLCYVESVDGKQIETNDGYNRMRNAIEQTIVHSSFDGQIINTTKKGAKIEHTVYHPLEDVMENLLTQKSIVQSKFIQNFMLKPDFSTDYQSKITFLLEENERLYKQLQIVSNIINDILSLYQRKVLANLNTKLIKFDKEFAKVKNNEIYQLLIVPMIRVQDQKFRKRSSDVVNTKNVLQKAKLFIEIFVSYFGSIVETYGSLQRYLKYINV